MDSHFSTFSGTVKLMIVVMVIIALGSLAFRGSLIMNNFSEGKTLYEVKVPTYDGTYATYLTTEYTIENGCIKFVDEYKFQQEICDKFTVTKWK